MTNPIIRIGQSAEILKDMFYCNCNWVHYECNYFDSIKNPFRCLHAGCKIKVTVFFFLL